MRQIYLSVIIPFYNEKGNLPLLHKELLAELKKTKKPCEIIYINDGSNDNSEISLKKALKKNKDSKIKSTIISFNKNFGQTAATAAGIRFSKGNLVAFLDADLQNDPMDLTNFLKEIDTGHDAVFGWRKKRKDNIKRVFLSKVANVIIQHIFKIPLHDIGCSLKVVKKSFIDELQLYGESHRILPVLIFWKGAKLKEVVVNHHPRKEGSSKYGYSRIFKIIIDLTTAKFLNSYGTKPAYVFGSIGLISGSLGFLTFLAVSYRKIAQGSFVHRDPLFIIAIFFSFIGLQFILMGLLAEILVRIYFESQKKTTYEIKEKYTF